MAKFTCPFCLDKYNFKKIMYVCPDCKKEAVPKIFERRPIKCRVQSCGGLATVRVCPICKEAIPNTVLESPHLPLSIIGPLDSGKTTYITTLLQELRNSTSMRLAVSAATRETLQHQKTNLELLWGDDVPAFAPKSMISQVWAVKNLAKTRSNSVPTFRFTICDYAFEDCEPGNKTLLRYVRDSEFIILTVDALTLKGVRERINLERKNPEKDAVETVSDITAYLRSVSGIRPEKPLPVSVAVVLTKFDTLLMHEGFTFSSLMKKSAPSISNHKADIAEMDQVSREICNWLKGIDEAEIVDTVETNFRDFKFFAVSSLGSKPVEAAAAIQAVQPHRVLDPMLWLLKLKKVVE